MHPLAAIPLAACLAASALAGAAWVREPRHPGNRRAAAMLLCTGAWALCELLWNAAASPEAALRLGRLPGLAFLWLGPLSLSLRTVVEPERVPPGLRRLLPRAYVATAVLGLVYAATPWFVAGVVRVPWGWSPVFGPAQPLAVAWTAAYPLVIAIDYARNRRRRSARWRRQMAPLGHALAAVLAVALATEVALPASGIAFPRLGSAALCAMGAVILLSIYRFGVTPGALAREILEAFPDGIAVLQRDGRIRFANQNLARLGGCERSALRGLPLRQFVADARFDPRGEVQDLECAFTDTRGISTPVCISSSFLRERQGAAIGQVVAIRDLSQVVAMRNELVTGGRLAAVGELAAAITHEINNPMAFVRSDLGMLALHGERVGKTAERLADPELADAAAEIRELVAETRAGAERVAAIVRDVRSFSQAAHGEREGVDLNRLCEDALRVALPRVSQELRVVRSYADVPAVRCAPRQLMQVFLNLLSNAAQAVGGAGTIRVATEADGERVIVRVEDDGPGIAPDAIERIFDPFFTTKPVGEGVGLGLSISRQIVLNHGGDLSVESGPQRGTSFRIRLPVSGEPPRAGGE